MKKQFISLILAVSLSTFAFGQSQKASKTMQSDRGKDGWEKIGEKTVDLKDTHGIFNWDKDHEKTVNANEKYSALKFKAKDATVKMTNVEVQYADGQKQNLSINSPVMVNSESKVVNLNNKNKKLDKITFNFQKDESAPVDKAKVELWGLKTSAGSAGMGQKSGSDVDHDASSEHSKMDHSKMDHNKMDKK